MGAIVEQISELVNDGIEVIFVSSGAVGMGKRLLKKQGRMQLSLRDLHTHDEDAMTSDEAEAIVDNSLLGQKFKGIKPSQSFAELVDPSRHLKERKKHYDSAAAGLGQFELMNLYSNLFGTCEVTASQILVTQADFMDDSRRNNLTYTIDRLLSYGIVPIVNENDAVSGNIGYNAGIFSDNDSLSALCARTFDAEVLVMLTDVAGVYDRPPSEEGAKMLPFFTENDSVTIGEKSVNGRGGMKAKIDAALGAVRAGSKCNACVVVGGDDLNAVRSLVGRKHDPELGPPKGTLFATPGTHLYVMAEDELESANNAAGESVCEVTRGMALSARNEARKLQALPYEERRAILYNVAGALIERKEEILMANNKDLMQAEKDDVDVQLVNRLKLTDDKLDTLATGIRQITDQSDPLGVVKKKRELADGLILSQLTVPIGVLMIIFESRPDSMPQISALALASGNGLLLKGGKEAAYSNAALHQVIGDAIEAGSNGKIKREIIGLVTSRGQVADMLSLDDVIDLVIPRGSNALVQYIKQNTKIPVLGHADGVCHVYVSPTASAENATKLVVDAKTNYPSACNAMETMLLHKDTLENGVAMATLMGLRSAGVKVLGGPNAMKAGLCDVPAKEMKCEYGDLTCLVEVVDDIQEAIDWIHNHGSGHTEAIVCSDDDPAGEFFLQNVDAACVFKNASTRFADGFRFGLGAEVGISTGRIHARGPVGVEGLLTTKWQLRSEGLNYAAEFGGEHPQKTYTHKELM
jgi:delta-1-pyrroline-5-carboxylate synthetase